MYLCSPSSEIDSRPLKGCEGNCRPGGKQWQPTARFMTHVTCRLTTKNRDQLRNPKLGNRVLATFTFFYFWLFTLSQKKTICNPLAHPTWKSITLTCEIPNCFYLTEGLRCTCIFRTCVFHPCKFVLAFSVLAFSSTCVFSAPVTTSCCNGVTSRQKQRSVPSACHVLGGGARSRKVKCYSVKELYTALTSWQPK